MKKYSFQAGKVLLFLPATLLLIACGINHAGAVQDPVEQASAKVWVGKKAKGFVLPDTDGKPVDVGKSLGKRPVVLVFYRGVW